MSTEKTSIPSRCTHCQADLSFPIVCVGCRSLYAPPESLDYFTLLGLDRRYFLDEQKLRSTFQALTKHIHPDKFSGAPEEVRRLSTKLAADVNNAITVLLDPVRRAAYLLDLAGGPTAAQDRSVPGDLLAEVMTLREEIAEAHEEKDSKAPGRIRDALTARRVETLEQIGPLAEELDQADDERKIKLRRLINAMKYFDNLLAELAEDPLRPATGAEHE